MNGHSPLRRSSSISVRKCGESFRLEGDRGHEPVLPAPDYGLAARQHRHVGVAGGIHHHGSGHTGSAHREGDGTASPESVALID